MRAWRLSFVMLALVQACREQRESPSAAQSVAPSPSPSSSFDLGALPPPAHRVAGSWTAEEGVEWRAIVIAKDVPRADLRRLARTLHADHPRTFFDVYDDDYELPKLVAAKGNDDALTPTWREAHAVGTIAGTVGNVQGQLVVKNVTLYEWKTNTTTPLP